MLQSLARLQSLGPEFVAKIAKPTYPNGHVDNFKIFNRAKSRYTTILINTLWLFNMAMENGPFIDDIPS
jgi:hypothetical protein